MNLPADKYSPCPFCGSRRAHLTFGWNLRVVCSEPKCRAMGPEAESEEEAMRKWAMRSELQTPKEILE